MGLLESIHLIAAGLEWALDEAVEFPPEPITSSEQIETALGTVKPGQVAGLPSRIAFSNSSAMTAKNRLRDS